jgi:solute carrier family 25 protein 34/35
MDNFIFGGIAAGMAVCVVNPIDVVKSRIQMQGEGGAGGPAKYTGTLSAVYSIGMKEGVRGLYRGLAPAICFQVVGNSTRFGTYYVGKQYVGADKVLDSKTNFALALCAGGLAGIVSCPFFTLKTQLQVQSSVKELVTGHQHAHSGFVSAISNILKKQGVAGLYSGLPAFFVRCVALVGAQMTTYDWAKQVILDSKKVDNGPVCHVIASAVAAGAACVCMQPFDLIGARMMNQPVSAEGKKLLYKDPIECFSKTLKSEGPLGFYKGVSANYLRMGPQYILTFVFFEKLLEVSNAYRERKNA